MIFSSLSSLLGTTPRIPCERAPRGNRAAFSLVEIVLAVGIVGFALITIIGLQPVGLTSLRASMDSTIETQIINQLFGEVSQTDFSRIERYEDSLLYFNADGHRVGSAAEARFQVQLEVVLPSSTFSPFPSAPSDIQTSLNTVRLEIGRSPAVSGETTRVHVFHVARSDKLL